jgi:tetratricopeptide (TPR) repeat protein
MATKSKGLWLGCGIPAAVLGLTILCVGAYFAVGLLLSNSIDAGYAEGNCEPSIKYVETLETIYPLAIAPFAEQALKNAVECSLYTQAANYVETGEHEQAYQAYKDYTTTYTDGKFTELAKKGAAQALLEWGQQELAEGKYEKSVQTLSKLLKEYPNSTAVSIAKQVLPDAYLAWSKDGCNKKDYANAASHLEYLKKQYAKSNAAAQADALLAQIYVEWGETYWRNKEYKNATAKIEHAKANYPKEEYGKKASELLPQVYLEWGQVLHGQKSYAEAAEKLNTSLKLSGSASNTSEQVRECLCSLHKDWSVSLFSQKKFQDAVSHYESATSFTKDAKEKSEIADSIASVYLAWANDLRTKQQYIESLDKIKLAEKASKSAIITDQAQQSNADTITAFSNSSGSQAKKEMTTAAGLVCQGKAVSLPIFALDLESKKFFSAANLPADLTAKTPAALHYVVCVTTSERKIQTCPYRNTVTYARYYLERYLTEWQVKVFNVLTGKLLSQNTFTGPYPKACPRTEYFSTYQTTKKYIGDKPETKALHDWLLKLKLP